ncbi:hypothetical protein L7F22_046810 [Adiantum nelumboides]|nr:hypothetical protein [Adiantum nelumboides]
MLIQDVVCFCSVSTIGIKALAILSLGYVAICGKCKIIKWISGFTKNWSAYAGLSKEAQGLLVGSSLVDEDKLELATALMEKDKGKGVSLLLPTDVIIAEKFSIDANSKVVPASKIIDGWMGLDIGLNSIKTFSDASNTTKTVIWNVPMGVFELQRALR